MRRLIALLIGLVAIAAIAAMSATPAAARPRGTNGKIVTNSDNLVTGEEQVYTVDPDGTDQQLVYNNSEVGQWSPDGTRIALVTQLGPPAGALVQRGRRKLRVFRATVRPLPGPGALLHGVVTGRRPACLRGPRPDGSEPDRRLHPAVIGRRRPAAGDLGSDRRRLPQRLLAERQAAHHHPRERHRPTHSTPSSSTAAA